jgi:PhzF family phenazine biosynthesis protein
MPLPRNTRRINSARQVSAGRLERYAAFTQNPAHGNPAGVWIGDTLPDTSAMLQIAADVGYSETAFVAPASGLSRQVRYYSPEAEVPFCGHATIATGVALGKAHGAATYELATAIGNVPVTVTNRQGVLNASLTSVEPASEPVDRGLLQVALACLRWQPGELDPAIPPALAYAGARHLVIAAATRGRLASLDYHFEGLKNFMLEHDLTTVQLIWRESERVFHARNPFPVGGIVEDPATGAAAAALGGYLRANRFLEVPGAITVLQGEDLGRPARLDVSIPATGGIVVSGRAVPIPVDDSAGTGPTRPK